MNDNSIPSNETSAELTPEPKPLAVKPPLRAGATVAPIVPRTYEEAWRISVHYVKTGMAPRDMKTPERVQLVLMAGLEIGLPPVAALNNIAIINNKPRIWGAAVPALALNTGQLVVWDEKVEGEGDQMVAKCLIARRVSPDLIIRREETFSVDDAKRAGLWQTDEMVERLIWENGNRVKRVVKNDSPWYRYPKRMLKMRARVAFTDLFSDVYCGLGIAEVYVGPDSDAEMRDVTPRSQPVIHNPLEDEADAERPARDLRDHDTPQSDIGAPSGAVILEGDEAARALTDAETIPAYIHDMAHMADFTKQSEVPDYSGNGTAIVEKGVPDHDPETGEVFDAKVDSERRDAADAPEAVDNMAGVTGTPSTGLAKPVEPPKSEKATTPRARPRPTPRQARTEPAGEPKAEAAPKQPPADKTSPGVNAALGVSFPQPWIRKTAAEYEAYLQEWVAAWLAYGKDPDGLRNRYSAERTIRSGLGEPADHDTLTKWKTIASDVFKKLGGQS